MKDTDHLSVHGSVHLCGERKFNGAQRVAQGATIFWDAEKNTGWAGATSLGCHRNRGGRLSPAAGFTTSFGSRRAQKSDDKKQGGCMSIINRPPEIVKREYELQEPVAQAVEKYAAFIQSTPDHVVNSALKMVIWKDAEFRRWRKQPQSPERKEGADPTKAARA
jgi:hypothetical protein